MVLGNYQRCRKLYATIGACGVSPSCQSHSRTTAISNHSPTAHVVQHKTFKLVTSGPGRQELIAQTRLLSRHWSISAHAQRPVRAVCVANQAVP